jgi:hypothetical protein
MSGYNSTEDHERAMRHNVKLSRKLMNAKEEIKKANEEAEQAKLAFRKLAEWSYQERRRLMNGLGGTKSEYHVAAEQRQVEGKVMDISAANKIKQEGISSGSEDYEPPAVCRGSSIEGEIDDLIAEEKGRLPFAEF